MIKVAGITVRPALATDAAALDDISDARQTTGWPSLAAPTSRSLLAITSQNVPVGFIEAQWAGDDVEIIMITTQPSARRTGVATRLLEQLLVNAADEGASRVILDVAEDNTAARQLYDKAGFREIARRVGYYRPLSALPSQIGRQDALLLAHHFASGTDNR